MIVSTPLYKPNRLLFLKPSKETEYIFNKSIGMA